MRRLEEVLSSEFVNWSFSYESLAVVIQHNHPLKEGDDRCIGVTRKAKKRKKEVDLITKLSTQTIPTTSRGIKK